jgi:hypothetical protein
LRRLDNAVWSDLAGLPCSRGNSKLLSMSLLAAQLRTAARAAFHLINRRLEMAAIDVIDRDTDGMYCIEQSDGVPIVEQRTVIQDVVDLDATDAGF